MTAAFTATKKMAKVGGLSTKLRLGLHRALLREGLEEALGAVPRSRRALDLGCGDVPYGELMTRVTHEHVTYDVRRGTRVDVVGSALALPFRSDSFDLVLSTQVLEHVSDPLATIAEVARVLVKGGHAVLSVPQMVALHEAPHDYFRFTEYGITHLLKANGLSDVRVSALGGFWTMLAQQLEFRLLWDRGVRVPWLRRLELGLGRLMLAALAALDGAHAETRYALNLVVVARRGP